MPLSFLNPFDWSGVASRRLFWFSLVVSVTILTGLILATISYSFRPWFFLSALTILQFVVWPVFVKRLHDMGRSGLWSILLLVPVLFIGVLLWLGLGKSKHQPEQAWPTLLSHRFGQLLLLLLICGAFSRAFWTPYWIPAGSMKPALLVGDYLVVTQYGRNPNPDRGDVVVFRHPVHGTDFVKRLIGLPGDNVKVSNGHVSINGTLAGYAISEPFEEPMLQAGGYGLYPRCYNTPVKVGETCLKQQWIETLPSGPSIPVLNIANQTGDHTGVFQIPDGHYFFLGDNRDNSNDSRIPQAAGGLGYVPREHLIGQARLILFSSAGPHLLSFTQWRQDRFAVSIR